MIIIQQMYQIMVITTHLQFLKPSTETTIETSNDTTNETVQGNSTQSADTIISESAPLMNLPLMIFTGFIGLYIFKRKVIN